MVEQEVLQQKIEMQGGFPGFNNLLRAELNRWFGTSRWLFQSLLWVLIIDGVIGVIGLASKMFEELEAAAADAQQIFGLIAVFGSIGVVILMQNVIINERENGVASWILSKPVSRSAYLLAKLIGNTAGILVSIVLIPGLIAYPLISQVFVGSWLSFPNFLGALAVLALEIIFYTCLTLMLGTFFRNRGGVLAVPLALIFGQQPMIGLFPGLIHVLPYSLGTITAGAVLFGEEVLLKLPLLTTPALSLLFVFLADRRFREEEL